MFSRADDVFSVRIPPFGALGTGVSGLYGSVARLVRLVFLAGWLAQGLLILALCFPWLTAPARGMVTRFWSRGMLQILGVHCRVDGALQQAGGLLVANHVSWLDPFVLLSMQPMHFVAKSEIRRWPVFGWLADHAGTVFIERERVRDVHRVAEVFAGHVGQGEIVAMFPEATTSDGTFVRPFKTALFQVAVTQNVLCLPVALSYAQAQAAWIDDMGFVQSVWRISALRRLDVRVVVCDALSPAGLGRRELARRGESAIADALSLPVRRNQSETSDDRPV